MLYFAREVRRVHFVRAKGILSAQNGMNIYRGCQHGCIYCDSRSRCYGFTHDFEDIEVKENAPELLERAMRSKRRRCMISTGSMSDPYMPLEKELGLTRRCLELIRRYEFGASVITKSDLILRDLELWEDISLRTKAVVQMTLTTFDEELCAVVEPHVASTHRRCEVLKTLREHGIPTVVWLSPLLPFINDTEENLDGILRYCADAGVKGIVCFGMGLTLRDGDREYFYAALDRHFPGLKERYIRTYGGSYNVASPREAALWRRFDDFCGRYGIMSRPEECFAYIRQFEDRNQQMTLAL